MEQPQTLGEWLGWADFQLTLTYGEVRPIRRWKAIVEVPPRDKVTDDGDWPDFMAESVVVATASGAIAEQSPNDDVADRLDEVSGDFTGCGVLFEGGFVADWVRDALPNAAFTAGVLICDRFSVAPELRRHGGIGRYLALRTLELVSTGLDVTALWPQAFETPHEASREARKSANEAVRKVWASCGFRDVEGSEIMIAETCQFPKKIRDLAATLGIEDAWIDDQADFD